MKKDHLISEEEFEALGQLIGSTESVVGIDAKKTHILILHKLNQIEDRIKKMEKRLKKLEK